MGMDRKAQNQLSGCSEDNCHLLCDLCVRKSGAEQQQPARSTAVRYGLKYSYASPSVAINCLGQCH